MSETILAGAPPRPAHPSLPPASRPTLGAGLTLAMAATTGLGVANIYYNQPMLGLIEVSMPSALTALVPTVTQLGYALGLFLLVPLGDRVERRALIVTQFLLLSVALVLAAIAPSPALLLGASLLLGALATVAQQIVPFAAHLAPPERSGAVIGKVMAGLLCGILLSRTLAGFVAQHAGWRAMFWLGVPLALLAAAILRAMLPKSAAGQGPRYPQLLASLWHLWRAHRALRLATITQGLLFAAFSAFWSILALRLAEVGEGPSVAGLFGVIGAVGILAAPLAGHVADRRGPHATIVAGVALMVVAWAIAMAFPGLVGLALACIVLDLAVQSALISHQHIVYALDQGARARLNTLFMGGMFLLGAAGSALAALAWHGAGWTGVSGLGLALGVGGGIANWLARRPRNA
ncbi:MFS transporter [Novosphingobium sp. SG720]|uniref:MFS transporter n=1 Tax=Novosphingobium sp. SG720 TaxID=2586998 RepID=UPI00180B94E1|nr:putative MFS family arabinose efflux permease [Novosphingobium sp. SG720]